ncbi:MAG: STAS domain-containing protein [Nitrospiraceae bacterium]|nr:STAS domain-containing protein [Nitrospiraceae bacterium]
MNDFSLSLQVAGDVVIMRPKGYVDNLGAEQLEVASSEALGKGMRKLVVNFSETRFINSVGVSILISVIQRSRESAGKLCFTNVKKVHEEVFDLLGLTEHVKVFSEEGEAIHYLRRGRT